MDKLNNYKIIQRIYYIGTLILNYQKDINKSQKLNSHLKKLTNNKIYYVYIA